ncbi:MAG: hypothetical protein RQ757_13845 [Pseudomonadales bacterium]|nr:hypothetical protein [Pseudomonadales bacterium]
MDNKLLRIEFMQRVHIDAPGGIDNGTDNRVSLPAERQFAMASAMAASR